MQCAGNLYGNMQYLMGTYNPDYLNVTFIDGYEI